GLALIMPSGLAAFFTAALAQQRWPRPTPGSRPPRRILLIRLNRLGDLVCALPIHRSLARSHPAAEIDWLLSPQNAVLAPFLKTRGQTFVLRKTIGRYFLDHTLVRSLQARQYDVVVAIK